MIVFDKDGDIRKKANKKVDDEFLDKCRKSAELFNKDEEWSYEKARDDYIKECRLNEKPVKISCENCKFHTTEYHWGLLGTLIFDMRCLVKEKYITFEGFTAKNCKYYTRRGD